MNSPGSGRHWAGMRTWLPGCRSTAWRSAQPWQRVTGAKTTACSHSCSMPGQTWPPAIRDLTGDHAAIAAILHQIRALALHGKATPAESLPELRRELDALAAIGEPHFGYKDRAIQRRPRPRRARHRMVAARAQAKRAAASGALRSSRATLNGTQLPQIARYWSES